MKKFALVWMMVLAACGYACGKAAAPVKAPAPGKVAASRPSLIGLLARADKLESAGKYSQAAKSARAAIAVAKGSKLVPLIRKRLRRLALLTASARRLSEMKAALARKPDDMAVRERIIRLCVIELDNPSLAMEFINEDVDQMLRTFVPLAARKIDRIPEAQCRELADWYASLLKTPSRLGTVDMLRRVATYCGRFVKLHTVVDEEHRRAAAGYADAVKRLSDIGETIEKSPSWNGL